MTDHSPLRFRWERALRATAGPAGLGPVEVAVGLLMASYGNNDGSAIRPGEELLAQSINRTTRTVRKAIGVLRDGGFIELASPHRPGVTAVYRLTIPEHRKQASGSSKEGHRKQASGREVEHRKLVTEDRKLVTGTPEAGFRVQQGTATYSTTPRQPDPWDFAGDEVPPRRRESPDDDREFQSDPWDEIEQELVERDASAAAEGSYVPSWQRLRP
jgi:hypothetical protein